MAYDINCPHCGYGYTPEELFKTKQLNKAGTFKANCRTLCRKDFEIEVVPSFNYFENRIEEAPMDLIEKLGGYESAKGVFSRMSACQRGCIEYKFVFFSFAGLQKALLEYRREHNIFEVGDKVVYNYPVGIDRIVAVNDEHLTPRFLWQIRHATDEEIKAGCRL